MVGKIENCVGNLSLACSFRNVIDNFVWAFVGVYESNDDDKSKNLWDELVSLKSWWELLWCTGVIFMLFVT